MAIPGLSKYYQNHLKLARHRGPQLSSLPDNKDLLGKAFVHRLPPSHEYPDGTETRLRITEASGLWFKDPSDKVGKIKATPRIRVDYAGKWAKKKWRFVIGEISR